MPLSRIIYFSENQLDLSRASPVQHLNGLMKTAIKNNRARNITGALIFDELWFIQTLEGDRSALLRLYERLHEDERHANICLASLEDIDDRMFGNWWMGFATRNDVTMEAFAPFLHQGKLLPAELTGNQLLGLITSVAKIGLNRQVFQTAA